MANVAYNHNSIEKAARAAWLKYQHELYATKTGAQGKKTYALTMFPYPSGDMHIGHWFVFTGSDVYARYRKALGDNLFFPFGFDAFGLPAENAAIKRGVEPRAWTEQNMKQMSEQVESMGMLFNKDRTVKTCNADYYAWTQQLFRYLYEAGLAYRKECPVDFCPDCNTTLAREQAVGGICERCGTEVEQKVLNQWFFKITKYSEELLDFSKLDWPERVIKRQRNWIGKSTGASVTFKTDFDFSFEIYTTRPDTLWGVTYMAIAPDQKNVDALVTEEQRKEVDACIERIMKDRAKSGGAEATKNSDGAFTGSYAINPVNGDRIPVYIADYVLSDYASGAIMAVPAHDKRDFNFAKKHQLPIRQVVTELTPEDPSFNELLKRDECTLNSAMVATDVGTIIRSDWLSGSPVAEAVDKVIQWLEDNGLGKKETNYRLHDWCVSRQRCWGAPIPIVKCTDCGDVLVPKAELPVRLPDAIEFDETGVNPLTKMPNFYNTSCPKCGKPATRETDTLDTFICSSWYQYRFLSPDYNKDLVDPKELEYWGQPDIYTGGDEHSEMHLLYTRFVTKALRDIGVVNFDEPMPKLRSQGMIEMRRLPSYAMTTGPDGKECVKPEYDVSQLSREDPDFEKVVQLLMKLEADAEAEGQEIDKMSKSKGNTVPPDPLVRKYGIDVIRLYMMFTFKWDNGGPWITKSVSGCERFLKDAYALLDAELSEKEVSQEDQQLLSELQVLVKKVSSHIENFEFNTAIPFLMTMKNTLKKVAASDTVSPETFQEVLSTFTKLLNPFAPHTAEAMWQELTGKDGVQLEEWPTADESLIIKKQTKLVIQQNGKFKGCLEVAVGLNEEAILGLLKTSENDIFKNLAETSGKRIFVQDKILNFVTK